MRKSFIIAAVLSSIWSTATAREVIDLTTMLPVAPTTSTAPERTVETLDDGVLVTYSFRYVAVDSAAYAPGACIYSFDGFGTSDVPEFPALPTHADFIEVPVMGASTLSIESIEHVSFISEIAPALEPMVESSTPKAPLPVKAYAGFYPQEQVCVSDEVNHRSRKALMLSVNPVSYNAETQEVRIATSVTYKINFPSGSLYGARSRARAIDAPVDDSPVFDNMILNSTAATDDDPTETKDVTADYLIITTDKMKSAVDDFATWKRRLGFRVHISSRDKWPSDSEVKDSIDKY
ncbi:MAG: hypothetical protein K2M97_01580, partial [Muribaculaceae bacterium]|nr:hypothetical protein [Muribaculaceae bacterium]